MSKRIIIQISLLLATADARATICPNLDGKWVGTCQATSKNAPSPLTKLQPLLQSMPAELDIVQLGAPNPLNCRLLTVQGSVITVGGMRNETLSVKTDAGELISMGITGGAQWDLANQSLITTSSGLIQIGDSQYIAIEGSDELTLETDGSLQRVNLVHGSGFALESRCSYQRKP